MHGNASDLPLTTRFDLGAAITDEQRSFLNRHGFIIFSRVASADDLAMITTEIDRIQAEWLGAGRSHVFGIPLFIGRDHEGKPFLQRLAFTSVFSEKIRDFVHDGRLWHRVARSNLSGAASLRRSMYLPYLTGPYEPKSDDSPTPAYHKVGAWLRARTARKA
jgi:hypothetical protein